MQKRRGYRSLYKLGSRLVSSSLKEEDHRLFYHKTKLHRINEGDILLVLTMLAVLQIESEEPPNSLFFLKKPVNLTRD